MRGLQILFLLAFLALVVNANTVPRLRAPAARVGFAAQDGGGEAAAGSSEATAESASNADAGSDIQHSSTSFTPKINDTKIVVESAEGDKDVDEDESLSRDPTCNKNSVFFQVQMFLPGVHNMGPIQQMRMTQAIQAISKTEICTVRYEVLRELEVEAQKIQDNKVPPDEVGIVDKKQVAPIKSRTRRSLLGNDQDLESQVKGWSIDFSSKRQRQAKELADPEHPVGEDAHQPEKDMRAAVNFAKKLGGAVATKKLVATPKRAGVKNAQTHTLIEPVQNATSNATASTEPKMVKGIKVLVTFSIPHDSDVGFVLTQFLHRRDHPELISNELQDHGIALTDKAIVSDVKVRATQPYHQPGFFQTTWGIVTIASLCTAFVIGLIVVAVRSYNHRSVYNPKSYTGGQGNRDTAYRPVPGS
jgi:hypothetical protein